MQAGAVLYVCLCGYEPFFGITDTEVKEANKKAVFAFAEGWEEVSDSAKDLVGWCCWSCASLWWYSTDPPLMLLWLFCWWFQYGCSRNFVVAVDVAAAVAVVFAGPDRVFHP